MNRTVLILLTLFFAKEIFAQNEAAIWYFGEKAGLDFRTGMPIPIYDGQLSTNEGCATINDKNGNLLFYTNGERVWNRNHLVMPNGNNLMGSYTSTHSAIVIPFPDNDSLYYVFTTADEQHSDGLRYSVINMKREGGLGDVVQKNILLLSDVHEKIAAVRKRNCSDYWVVTCKWNSDEYYAYFISSLGISSPVISKTGIFIGGQSNGSLGQIKFSPDGNKLAAAFSMSKDFVQLMDFDQATGKISNSIKLTPNLPPNNVFSLGVYGIEFSPNSKLLYTSAVYIFDNPRRQTLYQYDLSISDPIQMEAAKILIDSTQGAYGMQLGPDKKIYVSTYSNIVNVINNPNEEGTACGYLKNVIDLGTSSQSDFPTFLCSFFADPIIATGNCEFQNINFSIQNNTDLSFVQWDFGDPLSGADNTSNSFAPTHIYSQEGSYKVRLIYLRNGGCFPDTVYKQVYAGPFKLYLGRDTILCEGDTLLLFAKIPNAANLWSNGSADTLLKVTQTGKYWVRATLNSCWATDTIEVSFKALPAFSLGNDTAICMNSEIVLVPQPSLADVAYYWNNGSISPQISVIQPGNYWLTVKDFLGCKGVDTISISLKSLPQFSLGKDTSLCQTTLQLNATVSGASDYNWSTGAKVETINVNQGGLYWAEVTKDNCTYRDSITVDFKPFPGVNLGTDTTLCEGEPVYLDALNNGSIYLWNDGSTNQTLLVNKAGTYIVQINKNGCVSKDTITIKYDLKPSFTLRV